MSAMAINAKQKGPRQFAYAGVIVRNPQAKAEPLMKDMLVLAHGILRELAFH